MSIEMPNQLKVLLVLPFALLAIKGMAVTALLLGPTDSLLGTVKAPGTTSPMLQMQAPEARTQPAVHVPGTAKGPF